MSRSLRHAGKVVAAAVTLALLLPTPAQAQDDDNGIGGGGGGQDEVRQVVTVTAGTTYLPVGSEGSSGAGCLEESSTTVLIDDDFAIPVSAANDLYDNVTFNFPSAVGHPPNTRLFSATGRWFNYRCGNDIYLLPEGAPAVSIGGLVDRAIARLDPPEPALAVTPDHGKHAVQMPSWLAVDPTYWDEPRVATATSGRVRVQATLTPTEVSWDMGNAKPSNATTPVSCGDGACESPAQPAATPTHGHRSTLQITPTNWPEQSAST